MPRFALSRRDRIDEFILVDREEARLVPVGSASRTLVQEATVVVLDKGRRRRWRGRCLLRNLGLFRYDLVKLFLRDQLNGFVVASAAAAVDRQQVLLVVVQSVVDDLFQVLGDLGARRKVARPIVPFVLRCFAANLRHDQQLVNLVIRQFVIRFVIVVGPVVRKVVHTTTPSRDVKFFVKLEI